MQRRNFVTGASAAGAAALSFPMVAKAQPTFRWRMTTTWPAGLPFYQVLSLIHI